MIPFNSGEAYFASEILNQPASISISPKGATVDGNNFGSISDVESLVNSGINYLAIGVGLLQSGYPE